MPRNCRTSAAKTSSHSPFALLGGYSCFLPGDCCWGGGRGELLYPSYPDVLLYLASSRGCSSTSPTTSPAPLRLATTQPRLFTGPQWGKFLVCSVVGWLLPAVLVTATAALIDRLDIRTYRTLQTWLRKHTKVGLCWFPADGAPLLYFAGPVHGDHADECRLFVLSACTVYESSRSTATIFHSQGLRLSSPDLRLAHWLMG